MRARRVQPPWVSRATMGGRRARVDCFLYYFLTSSYGPPSHVVDSYYLFPLPSLHSIICPEEAVLRLKREFIML